MSPASGKVVPKLTSVKMRKRPIATHHTRRVDRASPPWDGTPMVLGGPWTIGVRSLEMKKKMVLYGTIYVYNIYDIYDDNFA